LSIYQLSGAVSVNRIKPYRKNFFGRPASHKRMRPEERIRRDEELSVRAAVNLAADAHQLKSDDFSDLII